VHFPRHGYVKVEDIVQLLEDAGLRPIRQGAVGMNDLNFVLAEKSKAELVREAARA